MIKQFFGQDRCAVGAIAVVGIEALSALVEWVVLMLLGMEPLANINYWVLVFVPALLVLRHYMKQRTSLKTTKGAIVALFVTFLAYMALFIKQANINNVL